MHRLPQRLRSALKDPLGPVRTGDDAVEAVRDAPCLVAVGDVVTRTFLDAGVTPHVMIIDHKTRRTQATGDALEPLGDAPIHRIPVANPAATITDALWRAVEDALNAHDPTVIDVDGEEDLATLPALVHAPDGAVVTYGQPDEGVVTVPVTPETRQRAKHLLSQMEA